MTPDGLSEGSRIRVLRGRPRADEVTAVLLALDEAAREDAAARRRRPSQPAWLRAARVEGVGGGPVTHAYQVPH